MSSDRKIVPALLNFDTALDWQSRWSDQGPFLVEQLTAGPSRRLIDLGSSTGETANWLAQQGFEVVGIEGVSDRWEVACAQAASGVEHLLGDLGAVEAMVRGQFGAAVCLGNTLPSLIGAESVARMFSGLRRRLLPGSPVLVHLFNYDRLFLRGERVSLSRTRPRGDHDLVFCRGMEPRDDGVVRASDLIFEADLSGASEPRVVHRRNFFQQGWRSGELVTILEIAQFANIELFGGFGEQPFESLDSEELVIVAR